MLITWLNRAHRREISHLSHDRRKTEFCCVPLDNCLYTIQLSVILVCRWFLVCTLLPSRNCEMSQSVGVSQKLCRILDFMQRLVSFKKDDVLRILTWFPKYTFSDSSNIVLFLILMMIQKVTFILCVFSSVYDNHAFLSVSFRFSSNCLSCISSLIWGPINIPSLIFASLTFGNLFLTHSHRRPVLCIPFIKFFMRPGFMCKGVRYIFSRRTRGGLTTFFSPGFSDVRLGHGLFT